MKFTIILEAPDGMHPTVFGDLVRIQVANIEAWLKFRGSLVQVSTIPELSED